MKVGDEVIEWQFVGIDKSEDVHSMVERYAQQK